MAQKVTESMENQKDNKSADEVQKAVEEVKEQDRRKCNIILYNVPESESDDIDRRREHDVAVIKELMKEE